MYRKNVWRVATFVLAIGVLILAAELRTPL